MIFPAPLRPARLIRRYKRFLADVELEDGTRVTAHCANPGAMTGLADAGVRVWLAPASGARRATRAFTLDEGASGTRRKLAWSWVLTELGAGRHRQLVGINALHANALAAEALAAARIPELGGYTAIHREVAYGHASRVDFLLAAPGRPPCYVEVKSVTLKRGPLAEFPDCVTKRGAKHMQDLARIRASGARAVILYVAQRGDCTAFSVAADIDGDYAAAFQRARDAGVEVLCYACQVTTGGIALYRPLPMEAPPAPQGAQSPAIARQERRLMLKRVGQ